MQHLSPPVQQSNSCYVKTMILGRHHFEHKGRHYHAELRILGFALERSGDNPRWVIFDQNMVQHWTLPGEGMVTETSDDVRLRFSTHLNRVAEQSAEEMIQ